MKKVFFMSAILLSTGFSMAHASGQGYDSPLAIPPFNTTFAPTITGVEVTNNGPTEGTTRSSGFFALQSLIESVQNYARTPDEDLNETEKQILQNAIDTIIALNPGLNAVEARNILSDISKK